MSKCVKFLYVLYLACALALIVFLISEAIQMRHLRIAKGEEAKRIQAIDGKF